MRKMLLYGDSLTYGFDPRGAFGGRYPESIRWTEILKRRLMNSWEIMIDAQNGREIPATPFETEVARGELVQYVPFDVFAVMLGTNDYLNMYQPDVVEVTGRMKRFLESVQAMDLIIAHGTQFLIISPPAIHTAQDEFYGKYDTTNGIFGKAYKALADHLGVHFVDTAVWNAPPAFDGIHLSEEANAVFADRMEETFNNLAIQMDFESPE